MMMSKSDPIIGTIVFNPHTPSMVPVCWRGMPSEEWEYIMDIYPRIGHHDRDMSESGDYGHPAINNLMRFFAYEHLPPRLQEVSKPIAELAHEMASSLQSSAELTAGLRKLLEAKDCFVRAALEQ
jgi:hypothetical protein